MGQAASDRYLRVIYVPDPEPDSVFRDHCLRAYREASRRVSQAQKEETSMSQNRFPDGWDEDKVQRVLAHYGEQTEDEALAEDEAGIQPSETVMNVPHDLVPKVRELIAKPHSDTQQAFWPRFGKPHFSCVFAYVLPEPAGAAFPRAAAECLPIPSENSPSQRQFSGEVSPRALPNYYDPVGLLPQELKS